MCHIRLVCGSEWHITPCVWLSVADYLVCVVFARGLFYVMERLLLCLYFIVAGRELRGAFTVWYFGKLDCVL